MSFQEGDRVAHDVHNDLESLPGTIISLDSTGKGARVQFDRYVHPLSVPLYTLVKIEDSA